MRDLTILGFHFCMSSHTFWSILLSHKWAHASVTSHKFYALHIYCVKVRMQCGKSKCVNSCFLLRMFCVMSLKVSSRKPPTFQKSLSIFQSMQEGILRIGFLCRFLRQLWPVFWAKSWFKLAHHAWAHANWFSHALSFGAPVPLFPPKVSDKYLDLREITVSLT